MFGNNNLPSPFQYLGAFGLCFVAGIITTKVFDWKIKSIQEKERKLSKEQVVGG